MNAERATKLDSRVLWFTGNGILSGDPMDRGPFEDLVTGWPSSWPFGTVHAHETEIDLSFSLFLCPFVCPSTRRTPRPRRLRSRGNDVVWKRCGTSDTGAPGRATFGNGQQVSERHIIFHVSRGLIENLYGPERQSLLRHRHTPAEGTWRCWCVAAATAAAATTMMLPC